jgi:hypothetical protein
MSKKRELKFGAFAFALVFLLSAAILPTVVGVKAEENMPLFGTENSLDWSGYVAATSDTSPSATVTSVSASWVVPTVASPPKRGYSVTWVGIGGSFSQDESLIQVGTAQYIDRGGVAYYFAWYEMLPASITPIDVVSPGDTIDASITMTGTNSWTISLEDSNAGIDFSQAFTYASSQLSAEWIEEAPSLAHKILPLANFDSVTFTSCQTTIGETTVSITGFGYHDEINMVAKYRGSYVVTAYPADLSTEGDSFEIYYGSPP